MAALEHGLGWLLAEEAFSVDGAPYSWGDVLVSAEVHGTLAELTAATRQRSTAGGTGEPSLEAVRGAASRFRYDRGLLSAEELAAWLARWRISVAEWMEHLERSLRSADRDEAQRGFDRAAAVDAICSGFLEREAKRLAVDAALAEVEATGREDRRSLVEEIVAAAGSARNGLAQAADVDREIAARALDWTRVDAETLELADPEAAREAALCVRIDGRALRDVAADCGVPAQKRRLYLEEAERDGLTALLGASPGELVGPLERNGGFLLVQVHARTRPDARDPELRRRATDYLVERASEHAVAARVRWS